MHQPINIEAEFKHWLSQQPLSVRKETTLNLYNAFMEYLFNEHYVIFFRIVNEFRKQ